MNREEIIKRFESDWGRTRQVLEKYSTEILRDACNSSGPFDYIGNLEYLLSKGLLDIDDLNTRSKNMK